jgi:hypothetical protein
VLDSGRPTSYFTYLSIAFVSDSNKKEGKSKYLRKDYFKKSAIVFIESSISRIDGFFGILNIASHCLNGENRKIIEK